MSDTNPAALLQEYRTGEKTMVPVMMHGLDGTYPTERSGWEYKAPPGQSFSQTRRAFAETVASEPLVAQAVLACCRA